VRSVAGGGTGSTSSQPTQLALEIRPRPSLAATERDRLGEPP